MIFTRGSNGKIVWSYDDVINSFSNRLWSFKLSGGTVTPLVKISGVNGMAIASGVLDVAVEEPATLALKNVNETYNGTYQFALSPSIGGGESEVVVFIAGKY